MDLLLYLLHLLLSFSPSLVIADQDVFNPLPTGLELAVALGALHGEHWGTKSLNRLLRHQQTYDSIKAGTSLEDIRSAYNNELRAFQQNARHFYCIKNRGIYFTQSS